MEKREWEREREREREGASYRQGRSRSSGKQMPMKAAHPANITQAYHYKTVPTIGTYPRFRTATKEYVPIRTYTKYSSLLPPCAPLGNSIQKLCPRDLRPVLNHGQSEYVSNGRRGVNPPQDTMGPNHNRSTVMSDDYGLLRQFHAK